jgi:nitrite reductase/ring-hydroxylating ferredoxin subunit
MAFTDVASAEDVREAASLVAKVGGVRLLLTRVQGKVYAVEDRCPHLGVSMARGSIDGSVLRCPWHGSTFDVCTGQNLDWIKSVAGVSVPQWSRALIGMGRRPAAVRTFEAREEEGRVLVDV